MGVVYKAEDTTLERTVALKFLAQHLLNHEEAKERFLREAKAAAAIDVIRTARHPNVRPMLDFFHFWSGLSKFEDLDLLKPGELAHAHFQDLLDGPKELIDNDSRLIPGDGIAPVVRILQKLAEKQYTGAVSVELFRDEFVDGDPFEVGTEIREKCEAVMRRAQVL